MSKKRIGFIGTGVMGRSMAANLMRAGHELVVYSRTQAKARELLDQGAQWADSPAEAASQAELVITIVGYPQDVEAVYLGAAGILDGARSGTIAIDMTTSRPDLAERLAAEGLQRGIRVMDAPVSGGDIGARERRLSIMVGGDHEAFDACRGVFEAMGSNIVYQGTAGSGQRTKLCNQIAIAGGMLAIGEALRFATRSGLQIEETLKSIASGAAGSWSMSNLVPKALKGDYTPGFFVKHFIKDLKIALDTAGELGIDLPCVAMAHQLYQRLADEGGADEGTQALFRYYLEE